MVELYLYSPYGPYGLYSASVPVQGCTLPLRLCNVLTEFGILMKLVRLIGMFLNETYDKIWVGQYLSIRSNSEWSEMRCFIAIAFQLDFSYVMGHRQAV